MPNGQISLDEFRDKMDEPTRLYYIWERLDALVKLKDKTDSIERKINIAIGAVAIINVVILPVMLLVISEWIKK